MRLITILATAIPDSTETRASPIATATTISFFHDGVLPAPLDATAYLTSVETAENVTCGDGTVATVKEGMCRRARTSFATEVRIVMASSAWS